MNPNNSDKLLRLGLITAGALLVIVGGIYAALNFTAPSPPPEVPLPVLVTPSPVRSAEPVPTATPVALATPTPLPSPTATATPTTPPASPTSAFPIGGIVYALSPDVNSVGWVQEGEDGNHFGESFLYTGRRDDVLYHGVMQFDLSFIPNGSTIFLAELELTGLAGDGLTDASSFTVNILTEDIDADWSRHNFEVIHNAEIDDTLNPILTTADLGEGQVNTLVFNAAQRSIIEKRLEGNGISLRLDSLAPELAGWFAWDSGYGDQSKGHGPILRMGVLPPVATEAATEEVAVLGTATPTPTFVVITSTPTPENILTVAAIAPTITYEATTTGTPTPFPANWVTPVIVTETPVPANEATALFQAAEATAVVIAFGTPTPGAPMVIATPTPTETATPVLIPLEGELPPASPTPVGTLPVEFMPDMLIGKIAFKSNRTNEEKIYVINPDGSGLALLQGCGWPYYLAEQADAYSTDGRFRVFTKDITRYMSVTGADGIEQTFTQPAPALFWYDAFYKKEEQLSQFGSGIAYGGAWSPTQEQIAFVSTESQNDEIWVVNRDSSGLLQLTRDEYSWWDKHPSWSPDGQHLVFWSNRTGHGQIFVMNADGSNLYSLSRTGFDDYDPVWIKYPGIPSFNPEAEDGRPNYIGSLGFCGNETELNCSAFKTQAEAQAAYTAAGGPLLDPYGLDLDRNNLACENLP